MIEGSSVPAGGLGGPLTPQELIKINKKKINLKFNSKSNVNNVCT